ncbi:serine hydrolase domain-containing protein [Candidatus Poribacteria bacterium]
MRYLFAMMIILFVSCGMIFALENANVNAGLPMAVPEEVGLSATRLERINPVMQGYVDDGKLAGLITVVARRGRIVHFERFGMMDKESDKAMAPDTIFRIYSMTKPITSVAIMMLYEEGRFQLNDPVSKFIPEFKDLEVFVKETESGLELAESKPEMAIWHLLTHTSGLSYGWDQNSPVDAMYRKAATLGGSKTLKDMIQKLGEIPLANQPGDAWRYSMSTDVLGYLVEVISGQPFDVFLKERIFEPLGMVDTGFYVPEEKHHRFAAIYGPAEGGGIQIIDPPVGREFEKPATLFSGGGGLVSTAADYMRFAQMLLNKGELDGKRLLGRKTVELMTMNHLPEGFHPMDLIAFGFGLGFGVAIDVASPRGLGSIGAFGWGGAAATNFWIDPEEGLIGLFMTQLMNNPYPIHQEFRVLVYQAITE